MYENEGVRSVTTDNISKVYLWYMLCKNLKVKHDIYRIETFHINPDSHYFALKARGSEPHLSNLVEKWKVLEHKVSYSDMDRIVEQELIKIFLEEYQHHVEQSSENREMIEI